MKLPISFEQFAKDPVKGLLFILVIAVGYLYVDNKMNYQGQVESCEERSIVLEEKVDYLTNRLSKTDSSLAVAVTKLKIIVKVNDIEGLWEICF